MMKNSEIPLYLYQVLEEEFISLHGPLTDWDVVQLPVSKDGEKVYRRLADVPEPVEFVNVFRPSADAADVVRQAVDVGAKAVWLQLGITSAEARAVAAEHGVLYVEDRCIAVEWARHALRRAG